MIWLSRGREAWSRCPWGRLCLGIIPEGAGFTLLAREDKHSLHMLREHDKGIASLNYIYIKKEALPLELLKRDFIRLTGKHPPSHSSSHKSQFVFPQLSMLSMGRGHSKHVQIIIIMLNLVL